jgi:carboxymethylenebutenolidase
VNDTIEIRTERIALETADGPMHAYVARPRGDQPCPGIVVFQEAYGVNAHIREVTERLARLGFVAIAPELFHRTAGGFESAYGDFAAVRPHYEAVSPAGIADDARAAHRWLEEHADPLRTAIIGFCMGGRAAYVANAHLPFKAAIAFYGGGIAPDLLDLAAEQHAPILMFWGGKDTNIPPEKYRGIADALTAASIPHEQVVFSQAGHGFFCDARESYDAGAAAQAWELTKAFLRSCEVLN